MINKLFNLDKNSLIIGILVLLIIVLFFYIAYHAILFKCVNRKNIESVTPHYVYGILNDKNENSLIVNVLSGKMKYKITLNGINDKRSIGKEKFEEILKNNNGQIPKDINSVVLYCGAWTCNAAKNYYDDLKKRGVDVSNVYDYEGSFHEWACYAGINSKVFTFNSLENGEKMEEDKVREIRLYSAHHYYVYVNNLNEKKPNEHRTKLSYKNMNFSDNL